MSRQRRRVLQALRLALGQYSASAARISHLVAAQLNNLVSTAFKSLAMSDTKTHIAVLINEYKSQRENLAANYTDLVMKPMIDRRSRIRHGSVCPKS